MCKCIGCGVLLQNEDSNALGYTRNILNKFCERCFRINNYNDYKFVVKDNADFINILTDINKTNDLVVLVVDLFNINKNIEDINKYIKNNILLVLTKRDLIPKSCYDKKLIKYFSNYNLNIIDTVIVSSINNYNFDTLYDKILKYKNSSNVYFVGYTNSGKSTLINKIIYNYSDISSMITTSSLPNTTIDTISIKLSNELTLIDTPGLLDNFDIINHIDPSLIKKVIPTNEIKPATYQIKCFQSIFLDDLLRIDFLSNLNVTFYISNKININRVYKNTSNLANLKKYEFELLKDQDIVIQGLGFIKFASEGKVILYLNEYTRVFIRKSLI